MQIQTSLPETSHDWLSSRPWVFHIVLWVFLLSAGIGIGNAWTNYNAVQHVATVIKAEAAGDEHWQLRHLLKDSTPSIGTKPKGCDQ